MCKSQGVRLMKRLKNKFVLGFLLVVILISIGLGISIWCHGNAYEKQSSVYLKKLDWILPLSTEYIELCYDEETGGYQGWNREKIDYLNENGEVTKSVPYETGQTTITSEYQSISYLEDGYAIALDQNDKNVILDAKGNKLKENLTACVYLSNHKFSQETSDGREIFDIQTGKIWSSYRDRTFSEVFKLDEHTFAIGFESYQSGGLYSFDYILFDETMQPILRDKQFSQISRLSDNMRYFVTSKTTFDGDEAEVECGFMNSSNEVVFLLDHIPLCVNDYSEGLVLIYDEEELYALNKQGKKVFSLSYIGDAIAATQREVIENYEGDSPYYVEYKEGLAPVTLDGKKWGYINQKGKFVVEPVFAEAKPVCAGAAIVCDISRPSPSSLVHSRWGILDLEGVK